MAASLTLAFGLFSSCKKDEPKKVVENTEQEQKGITFTFTMPGGDAHVVDTRALHDNPEWAIDQLWMYVFDEKGETVMEEPVNICEKPEFKYTGTAASYTYKGKWTKDKQCQFFFVANMGKIIGKGATKADLMAKVHEKAMSSASTDILYPAKSGNEKRIPMTAYAMQGNSRVIAVTGNATVKVTLKRTVARIDIVNRIPDFKITKLELFNAFKKENVVEESTNVIADNRLTTSVAPFATLDANNTIGKRQGTEIKKAFYLYEGKNVGVPDNEVTYVKITAEYGGKSGRVYVIPFKVKDAQGKFTVAKDVKRNHLYKIDLGTKINQSTGTLVDFSIEEEPWKAIEYEEAVPSIYVKVVEPFPYLVTLDSINAFTLDASREKEFTLELDNAIKGNGTYTLATTDTWLTVPSTVTAPQANSNKATFTLKIAYTGHRKVGKITIKSGKLTEDEDAVTLTVKTWD